MCTHARTHAHTVRKEGTHYIQNLQKADLSKNCQFKRHQSAFKLLINDITQMCHVMELSIKSSDKSAVNFSDYYFKFNVIEPKNKLSGLQRPKALRCILCMRIIY